VVAALPVPAATAAAAVLERPIPAATAVPACPAVAEVAVAADPALAVGEAAAALALSAGKAASIGKVALAGLLVAVTAGRVCPAVAAVAAAGVAEEPALAVSAAMEARVD
jgi:hypothetical protein